MTKKLTAANLPVGCPPDLSPMSDHELEEHGKIIGRLRELAKQAEEGNDEVVGEIRAILEGNPGLALRLINIGKTAECFLTKGMTADRDLVGQQMIEHQLESMRRELAGDDASPLERLLAERVVATWLQVQHLESLCALSLNNLTLSQGGYYQKHLDRAHRNHLSAIRTLAQIRRLGPVVQINIAQKQINTGR